MAEQSTNVTGCMTVIYCQSIPSTIRPADSSANFAFPVLHGVQSRVVVWVNLDRVLPFLLRPRYRVPAPPRAILLRRCGWGVIFAALFTLPDLQLQAFSKGFGALFYMAIGLFLASVRRCSSPEGFRVEGALDVARPLHASVGAELSAHHLRLKGRPASTAINIHCRRQLPSQCCLTLRGLLRPQEPRLRCIACQAYFIATLKCTSAPIRSFD